MEEMPVRVVTRVPITVRLPDDLHGRLTDIAWQQRISINQLVIIALRAHLDAQREGKK